MCRVGRKANNDDVVVLRKLAKPVCAMGVVSVKNQQPVASSFVPSSRCRLKITFKPFAAELLVCPTFRRIRDARIAWIYPAPLRSHATALEYYTGVEACAVCTDGFYDAQQCAFQSQVGPLFHPYYRYSRVKCCASQSGP